MGASLVQKLYINGMNDKNIDLSCECLNIG
jgi:hypothetical protein